LNLGAVLDVGGLSTPTMALEPVIFADPTGAHVGVPTAIFLIPGTFSLPVAVSKSSKVGILGGGQIGYNWQQARWVYGMEADLAGTNTSESFSAFLSQTFPGVAAGGTVTRSLSAT
jgi:hypothetical protein